MCCVREYICVLSMQMYSTALLVHKERKQFNTTDAQKVTCRITRNIVHSHSQSGRQSRPNIFNGYQAANPFQQIALLVPFKMNIMMPYPRARDPGI